MRLAQWFAFMLALSGGLTSQAIMLSSWLRYDIHPNPNGALFYFYETSPLIIYTESVLLLICVGCSLYAWVWLYVKYAKTRKTLLPKGA